MQMHETFTPCVYLVTSLFNVEEYWVILLVREHGCPLRILLTRRVECLSVSIAIQPYMDTTGSACPTDNVCIYYIRYSSDVTLHSLASNLVKLV